MGSNRKAFKQLFFMMMLTLITQLVTLIKLSVTASNFGATVEMDAFNFSNSIGTFIFSFIGMGVTTVLIPALVNKTNKRSINNFITILYILCIILVIVVVAFRVPIITLFSSDSSEFVKIAASLMLITMVSQFSGTMLGVVNAHFQCVDKFNIPKVMTLITTIALTTLVYLNKDLTIHEYAFYILITCILEVILSFFFAWKTGFTYKPVVDFKDENMKSMTRVFLPTVVSTGVYQITLLTDSLISSSLGTGQISRLTYSNSIVSMINLLFIKNLMTYIYPKIAKSVREEDGQNKLFQFMVFFNAIVFVLVVGFMAVGKEGIKILYEGGKFTPDVTKDVYICTMIYMIGVPTNLMRDIIYRYFYAKGDTKTTLYNSVTASVLNFVLSIILAKFIGVYGVVLGTVITSFFSLTTITIRFKNKFTMNFDKKFVIKENLKIVFSCLISMFAVYLIKRKFPIEQPVISLIIYGIIVCVIYGIFLILLKTKAHKVRLD